MDQGTFHLSWYSILALALKLNVIETETLFRKVGKRFREAYKDAVAMKAIEQGIYDVIKVEAVLQKFTKGAVHCLQRKSKKS